MDMNKEDAQKSDYEEIVRLFSSGQQEYGLELLDQSFSQEEDKGRQAENDRVVRILTRLACRTNSPAVYLAIQMVKNPDRQE